MAWRRGVGVVLLGCGCVPNPWFGVQDSQTDATEAGASSGDTPTGTGAETGESGETGSSTIDVPTTDGPETGSSTGPGVDECVVLCGPALVCCTAAEECLAGACEAPCASAVVCEGECCAAGQSCLAGACVAGGAECLVDLDCPPGEFCDPGTHTCLPLPPMPTCEVVPGDPFAVELQWFNASDEVIGTPGVADVSGDGVPDIVVITTRAGSPSFADGEVVCLDGATGAELWRVVEDPDNQQFGAQGLSTVGLANINDDPFPDVVYAGRPDANTLQSAVHAVDGTDGSLLFTSHDVDAKIARTPIQRGAPAFANLDADDRAEFAYGGALFDDTGLLVTTVGLGGLMGSPHKIGDPTTLLVAGGLATFADLDMDGQPELITGREAWRVQWQASEPPQASLQQLWKSPGGDGWPAVADLDLNGTPEVVLVAYPEIKVLDGVTGKLWCGVDPTGVACVMDAGKRTKPITLLEGQLGGPAVIADFDGDQRPEFGLSLGTSFVVYDLARSGEVIDKPMNDPAPLPGSIFRRWFVPIQDDSDGLAGSASVGAAAYDFTGDGAAELLFQDECVVRVLDGASGQELLELENTSATIHEYPVVVDVDGDDRSELVVVANQSTEVSLEICAAIAEESIEARQGVYVYRPLDDRWTSTRRVWTEHTHHVTNAEGNGHVAKSEQAHWLAGNDFRRGPNGPIVSGAPDLVVELALGVDACPETLRLRATIFNQGSFGVPAGIDVAFYAGPEPGVGIGSAVTEAPLGPGAFTVVELVLEMPAPVESYRVVVDAGDAVIECAEENNHVGVNAVGCP